MVPAAPAAATTPLSFASRSLPAEADFLGMTAMIFRRAPDPAHCDPGEMRQAERDAALRVINQIRFRHRLQAVTYDESSEPEVMAASLMMAVNGTLDHAPPNSWLCYSAAGFRGAGSSNLSGGTVSPYLGFTTTRQEVVGWVTDTQNMMPGVGHRRWLLSPYLTRISFGRAGWQGSDGVRTAAAAVKVFDFTGPATSTGRMPDFVAYPYGNYPAEFFETGALLSFSPIVDRTDPWANATADLSRATVRMQTGGKPIPVTIISRDNNNVGGMSSLEFRAGRLVRGRDYEVQVSGITHKGSAHNYHYRFRVAGRVVVAAK